MIRAPEQGWTELHFEYSAMVVLRDRRGDDYPVAHSAGRGGRHHEASGQVRGWRS